MEKKFTVCEVLERLEKEHAKANDDGGTIRHQMSFVVGNKEKDVVIASHNQTGGDIIQRICHLLRVADSGLGIGRENYDCFHPLYSS
jgi:hypothetical protein